MSTEENIEIAAEAIQWLVGRGYKRVSGDWVEPEGHVETADDIEAINYVWHHATGEQLEAVGK
jgi:hypothetical protein